MSSFKKYNGRGPAANAVPASSRQGAAFVALATPGPVLYCQVWPRELPPILTGLVATELVAAVSPLSHP